MSRFIANIVAWGIFFLSMGTLGEITLWLAHKAAESPGLISLSRLNSKLTSAPVKEVTHSR